MARSKILALVLAGGQGGRMDVLTQERAKPALPLAGVYRLIDLSLSNLRNSGISDVWLVVQFETQSISEVVAGGRPWDLDRTHGGLRIIPPQQSGDDAEGEWHAGNADAIYQNRALIKAFAPDVLLVLSADHLYKLDFNDLIDAHLAGETGVTVVSTEMPIAQASNHGVVTVDRDGAISAFDYKPDEPPGNLVTTEIFAYDPGIVIETLEQLAARKRRDGASGSGLEDFGHDLLPDLVERGLARDYRLDGYWKDVGRPETYFAAHMDLIAARSGKDLDLDDPGWPIFTLNPQRAPARFAASSRIADSLVSPGCEIAGRVERSVLGPGVVVDEGAIVRDAVVFHDTEIRTGARVSFAIVDEDVRVGRSARVGQKPSGASPTSEELVLIGRGARVSAEAIVKRGVRIPPRGRR